MHATEEQMAQLTTYLDLIQKHLPNVAAAADVPAQTLKGWLNGEGEPTQEQAAKIIEFLQRGI